MPVPAPHPCAPARSFQLIPDRPQPRFTWLRGHLALLLLAFCLGTGCRATKHVVRLSQPHAQPVTHRVQALQAAYLSGDGRLLLHTAGQLAGERQTVNLTIALPAPVRARQPDQQRVIVPSTAVKVGWNPATPLRSVPVGPPLLFNGASTYEWERLRLPNTPSEEVRLVRRAGAVERWEVLHVQADAATGECHFTVFEVQPARKVVSYPAALALLPVAMASDVVAVGTMVAAPIAFTGACAISGAPGGLAYLDQLEPVKHFRDR